MKKLISVLLCVLMLMGTAAIGVSAADDMKIIVANDLHLSARSYVPYTGNTMTNPWAHVASSGQLIRESDAIITAFLDNAAKSDAQYILLPGDLVDTGTEEEHVLMAAKLADFEKETGKSVFVVPGNHDVFRTEVAVFKTIYNEFGYSEAVAKADSHASYTVDLGAKFRLVAIDSTLPADSHPDVDAEKLEWIKAQLDAAKADGKFVIAMMHHNLLEHFIFSEQIHSSAIVKNEALKDMLADGGVKYIFTGHTHDQDIVSYTSANGNTIYDVVTNSLNAYPCQYREVTFGSKNVVFAEKRVDKVDISLIPAGFSQEAMDLAESDFTAYTKKTMWIGLRNTFTSYINAAQLIKLLELDPEADADMCRIITALGDKLEEIVQMPFYTADENGKAMKDIAAQYGKTLPDSNYTDLIDLAITLYQAHCTGDEYFAADSTEINLLMNAVSTVLCYCLEDVSAEDYKTVLTFALEITGTTIPDGVIDFAGGTLERIEGIDMVASLVLRPLVVQFTTDSTPADNNVTLPGYETSAFMQFVQKVLDFFRKIFDFFKMIFTVKI